MINKIEYFGTEKDNKIILKAISKVKNKFINKIYGYVENESLNLVYFYGNKIEYINATELNKLIDEYNKKGDRE